MSQNIVPAWFTANRVHGHTRLNLARDGRKEVFTRAGEAFKALGAEAFTRHVKSGGENPWWASTAPEPDGILPPPDAPNVVPEFLAEAHARGLRIMAYYWHMAEDGLVQHNPEWVCKDRERNPIPDAHEGSVHLDITGPYREIVLVRLRELAAMGADALFFDYRHLPPEGCWFSALAKAWEDAMGTPAPLPEEEAYPRFLDFKAEQIEATFRYWRDEVKADHPDVVFIVSTTTLPALTDREMTTRLARVADSAKNEYRHAVNRFYNKRVFDDPAMALPETHVRQALGWTVLRDASDGRPPHIWARGVPDEYHARAYAASLMTFGCIANMDVSEQTLADETVVPPGKTPPDALRKAFALGRDASPHLAGTRALRWAAVHFPERIRDARAPDDRRAWREVLWPLVGAFQTLAEDGLPVGIVTDDQLEHGELQGYRLLVLPKADELEPAQQRAVTTFRRRGGAVLENDPAWPWSVPGETPDAASAFRAALQPHVRGTPVRVSGGPAGRYAVPYLVRNRLVVALTNDFRWVQIEWDEDKPANRPAPPADGMRVTWSRRALGGPIAWPPFRRLRAVEALTGTPLPIDTFGGGYHVDVPQFAFMALVVITRAGRPPLGLRQLGDRPRRVARRR
jgi:hypothetical protein